MGILKNNKTEEQIKEVTSKVKDFVGDNEKRAGIIILVDKSGENDEACVGAVLAGKESLLIPTISKTMLVNENFETAINRAVEFNRFLNDPKKAVRTMLADLLSSIDD